MIGGRICHVNISIKLENIAFIKKIKRTVSEAKRERERQQKNREKRDIERGLDHMLFFLKLNQVNTLQARTSQMVYRLVVETLSCV